MTSTNRMTDAQRMAQTLGVIIGAASCCEQVTEERVTTVAVKLKQLVSATAEDGADAEAANEQFFAGLEVGKTAAESGRIDPEQAEAALVELEEDLSV
jgi:hypothetical protein